MMTRQRSLSTRRTPGPADSSGRSPPPQKKEDDEDALFDEDSRQIEEDASLSNIHMGSPFAYLAGNLFPALQPGGPLFAAAVPLAAEEGSDGVGGSEGPAVAYGAIGFGELDLGGNFDDGDGNGGGAGNDMVFGEDGNDTLYFGQNGSAYGPEFEGGQDQFDGGVGDTDVIYLDVNPGAPGNWISFTNEGILGPDANGFLILQPDSDGIITLADGSTLTFTDVEKIMWH